MFMSTPLLRLVEGATRAAAAATLVGAIGCAHPQVSVLEVKPALVCAGKPATVEWEVVGPARLRAERSTTDWDEGDVPSKGTRTVVASKATTFTLTAVDGDPARGQSFRSKPLDVVVGGPFSNASTCDATTRVCTAKFSPLSAPGAHVTRLSAPFAVGGGRRRPARVCVTHQTVQGACLEPAATLEVDAPFDGEWVLQTTIEGDPETTPPPRLELTMEIACP